MIYNPITKRLSADPFVVYDQETGYYYCTYTAADSDGGSVLKISRARKVQDAADGEEIVLLREGDGKNSCKIWAPELYQDQDGTWYVYASAFATKEMDWNTLKILVFKSWNKNPFDGFTFVKTFDELSHAFDPTIYAAKNGKLYMCYTQNMYAFGFQRYEQRLYIREMLSPTELGDKFAEISAAELPFELSKPNVKINEGPFFLEKDEKLFIAYSANGCGNEDYCLGLLVYMGGDLCDKGSWKKYDTPILYKGEKLFGPGHASFFSSPDKTELWCAFHAFVDNDSTKVYKDRFACVNKVEFNEEGIPMIGAARVSEICAPSGE
ncbi:MAG: family 43 glycosylhydrolase [Oscillospiraceae bacterium]|nr:family 43 glycosylhydrolase [Oscillospiraceae bacterium]